MPAVGIERIDAKSIGFQLFKEHVDQYTPEWAAEVTGLSAAQIRTVAREFGENAQIVEPI